MYFEYFYLFCSSFLNKYLTITTFMQKKLVFFLQKQQYLRKEPYENGMI